jgi:phosphoribosylaminoimidazolecarboxamide formyltransferase / IMP cyclohydrolase
MTGTDVLPVRRALVSVADKTELVELGLALAGFGVSIVGSGTTASVLADAGIAVTPVSDVTGFPEMLEGRVKTLHPRVHGGILADKRKPEHMAELGRQGIEPFDLVVVNLYPFMETVLAGVPAPEVIEQIDIGGPALVRAAAKNFESVGIVVRPAEYQSILAEIVDRGGLSRETRFRLAHEAFDHTAAYDAAIAAWFADQAAGEGQLPAEAQPAAFEVGEEELPEIVSIVLARRQPLRYGENPHQRGGLYAPQGGIGPLGGAEILQGKEMSFNNWLDAEAARALAGLFDPADPAAVIVKHHNPCGVALAPTLAEAYRRALEGDPISAYGGIVAFNGEVDEAAAEAMAGVFTEVVVAPGYADGALAALAQRKNLRVVRAPLPEPGGIEVRPIEGGALVQDADAITEGREDMKVVTTTEPTPAQWADLLFAWKVAARVKSNAIVLASDRSVIAVGAGQMNRLTSVEVAVRHAGSRAQGSCLASDAFFPFRDGIDRAAEAGVSAVIQPGGSMRDEEVLASAEEHGLAMVFTGRRHFRH